MIRLSVLNSGSTARRHRLQADDQRRELSHEALASMEAELRRQVAGEVRFDAGARALYATDASNYRQAPLGVVLPRHAEDVEAALRVARQHRAPVLSRGGGTSLAGQACNTGLLLDFSKYMHYVVEIDAEQLVQGIGEFARRGQRGHAARALAGGEHAAARVEGVHAHLSRAPFHADQGDGGSEDAATQGGTRAEARIAELGFDRRRLAERCADRRKGRIGHGARSCRACVRRRC